ncbi:hypothetical protein P3T36_006816 [Kitasatospora sp. MAP12-15]|nr:hypothetical protein [Kitasatospora sp. MAP12-44]MDH6112157.1 hypothetical protein [Kitasatospora sp. MAP12-44]
MKCTTASVALVAKAAGLPFSAYDLGAGRMRRKLSEELFPRTQDYTASAR